MTSKSFTITSPYKLPAIVTSGNVRRPYNVANPPSVLPAKVELNEDPTKTTLSILQEYSGLSPEEIAKL